MTACEWCGINPIRFGEYHIDYTATPEALMPVGKDCDCGYPLVWRRDKQVCSVYGTHPTPIHYRHPRIELQGH